MSGTPLLVVRGLDVEFPLRGGMLGGVQRRVPAVQDASFEIAPGETLALVGESGCGKTTLARATLRLVEASAGSIEFDGADVRALRAEPLRQLRRRMQMVFQDPQGSLNPRMTVQRIVGDPLLAHGLARRDELEQRVGEALEQVGLEAVHQYRYPFEFSGGQRQRIGIARAVALRPALVVCDEAVSALDVSVQAQILNLLRSLRDELSLSYLFISHDLNVVRHVADRIAVMYLGRIVESGPAEEVMRAPQHPYTRSLIAANPVPDPDAPYQEVVLEGDVPSVLEPPSGCAFHPRCPVAVDECARRRPAVVRPSAGREVACHLAVPAGQA